VTSGTVAPGATVTITATAEAGYVFPGGETTQTFTHTFPQLSGEAVVVATVSFHNATAHHKAGWTGYVNGVKDTAGDHVTFAVTGGKVAPGSRVTITATAGNGVVFPGGTTTKAFTHTFTKVSGTTGASPGDTTGQTLPGQTSAGQNGHLQSSGAAAVPTAVEAGEHGDRSATGGLMGLRLPLLLLVGGGALLLTSGWLFNRKSRAGAHRA
jgi:hypothetical protein